MAASTRPEGGAGTSFFTSSLQEVDAAVYAAVAGEVERLQTTIELIASENIVSRAVLEAQGSVLTNKYAEGYPGRRYYGGCEIRRRRPSSWPSIAPAIAVLRLRASPTCSRTPAPRPTKRRYARHAVPARRYHSWGCRWPPAAT